MKKVLVTDGVHPVLLEGLEAKGYTCIYEPSISLAEVHQVIGDYKGIIINSKIIVDQALLDKADKLKFLARLGSGMEIVDQVYAKTKGVSVISSPEGNRNAVAEHALGMLLALANKMHTGDQEVKVFNWQREANRGFELLGKTIGLIGFGHTGASFAKKLAGLEMRVLAYDKYKVDYTHPFGYVAEATAEQIQAEADIISFHLPLTEEVHHFVNQDYINGCKKGVLLINTSRGSVIDTNALLAGLASGQVAGACLDVFENEKTQTFTEAEKTLYGKLYQYPNVILTPHVAGWTIESKRRLAEVILEKMDVLGL